MPFATRRLILAGLTLACVGACAGPASYTAMVPDMPPGQTGGATFRNAITVGSVTIGQDTISREGGTPWTSAVQPEHVRQALVQALANNQLGAANGRYRLDAILLQLERPFAGFAMTVTATIAWRLTDANGTVVYNRTLKGLGTATLDDAIDNNNRLRIADQRAIRANMQQMILDLLAMP